MTTPLDPELTTVSLGGKPRETAATDFVGPYRLLRSLGHGGMGEVWLAEQPPPLRREVAVKIIRAGMDTAHVIARFEAERQTLALMNHPAIATVFDGGSTAEGRPYFALEYVKGERITEYCERHHLTTRDRISLFLQVCDGVAHAHQKGIIHRDLKPSNILVTVVDQRPVPKIIDFGLAKAIGPSFGTAETTEYGAFIGTPEYMSPEQAEMGGADVDTRTDVYSLGVVLYELFTGSHPFAGERIRERGLDEIRRLIREHDPARPSTRASTARTAPPSGPEMSRPLVSELRGDLDWITLKAMAKDRSRRYGTVSELADDLRRHLANQPVLAGPPTTAYRVGKFARRHRVAVTSAAGLVLLLLGFGVTMGVQAARLATARDRANVEADVARQVSDFLVEMFRQADPSRSRGNTITARTLLDQGAGRIRRDLGNQPAVQARLMHTMATVYDGLGLYEDARPLFEEALAKRESLLGADHLDVAETASALGNLYLRQARYADAETQLRRALAIHQARLGGEHRQVTADLADLAVVSDNAGRYADAEALYRQALAIRERTGDAEGAARVSINLGGLMVKQAKPAEAEPLFRKALELEERLLGRDHPIVATIYSNIGVTLKQQRKYAEAEPFYQRALDIRRRVLGPNHASVSDTLNNLGNLHLEQDHDALAEPFYRESLSILEASVGSKHPSYARTLENLALVLEHSGKRDEAESSYRQALAIKEAALGLEHPDLATTLMRLGELLETGTRSAESEPLLRRALAVRERSLGADNVSTALVVRALARTLASSGRTGEAETLFERAFRIQLRELPAQDPNRQLTTTQYAQLLRSLRREADAVAVEKRNAEPSPRS